MGKVIEVPQEHDFECLGCVYSMTESVSNNKQPRTGCKAENIEPFRSCMSRKVKFVDEETYRRSVDKVDVREKEVQRNLFGF